MPNLFEDATTILSVGIFLEVVLGIYLAWTGRGWALLAMGGVLAATLVGLVVERVVVTPRERVAATLEAARAGLTANQRETVLLEISPEAAEVRRLVDAALGEFEFTETRIRDLKITLEPPDHPVRAVARFLGLASFHSRRGEVPYQNYLAEFVVRLELRQNRWLITAVDEVHPGGLQHLRR